MGFSSDAEILIDKYLNPIAEPVRLSRCPALIRELGRATQAKRHLFTDAAGARRERMPMGVIAASYFLRAGNVLPTAIIDILYRNDPSISCAGPPPFRPAPGSPAMRRRPRPSGRKG